MDILTKEALRLAKLKYDKTIRSKKIAIENIVHYCSNLIELANCLYGYPDRALYHPTKVELLRNLDSIFSSESIISSTFAYEKKRLLIDAHDQAIEYLFRINYFNTPYPYLQYNFFEYSVFQFTNYTIANPNRRRILDIAINKVINSLLENIYSKTYKTIKQQQLILNQELPSELIERMAIREIISNDKLKLAIQQNLKLDVQILLRDCYKKAVKNIDNRFLALIIYLNALMIIFSTIFYNPNNNILIITEHAFLYFISALILSDIISYFVENTLLKKDWDRLSLALISIFGALIARSWIILDVNLGCRTFKGLLVALTIMTIHGLKALTPCHIKLFKKDRFYLDKGFRFLRTLLISARNITAVSIPAILIAVDGIAFVAFDIQLIENINTQNKNCFHSASDFFTPTPFFITWLIVATSLVTLQIAFYYFMLPIYAKKTEKNFGLQKWFFFLPFSLTINKLFKSKHAENIRSALGVIFTTRILSNIILLTKNSPNYITLPIRIIGALLAVFIGPLIGSLIQISIVPFFTKLIHGNKGISTKSLYKLLSENLGFHHNSLTNICNLITRKKPKPETNFEVIQTNELAVPGPIEYGIINIIHAVMSINMDAFSMHYYERVRGDDLNLWFRLFIDFTANTLFIIFIEFLLSALERVDILHTILIEITTIPTRIYNLFKGILMTNFCEQFHTKVVEPVLVMPRPSYYSDLRKGARQIVEHDVSDDDFTNYAPIV